MDSAMELRGALECYLFGKTLHFLRVPNDGSLEASGDLGLAWIPQISPDPAMTENSLATGRRAANLDSLSWIN